MLRSSNSVRGQHQSTSSIYDYKTLNEMVMRTTNTSTSNEQSVIDNHEPNKYIQPVKTSLADESLCVSLQSMLSTTISLCEVIIEGNWRFRAYEDDQFRFKSMGIDNLVYICHDIMNKTLGMIKLKQQNQRISSSSCKPWPIVNVDNFEKLTDVDRAILNRAHVYALMTIIFEATSSSISMSQQICYKDEVVEHINNEHSVSKSHNYPKVSYETAFRHLIHTPDNQLLQVALHASLITGHSRMELQELGEKLGVKRHHFDMGSIKDSTKTFQDLIKLLREQKLKREREQQYVDTNKLPYKPKKKRGLSANVSGTKFAVVRQAADVYGFSLSSDGDTTSNLLWHDTLISMDIVSALKPYQKVNHFPTMSEISRKDSLARNFDKLSRTLPDEYNFTPKTWILPNEYNSWYSYASSKPKKDQCTYILKPNNGAMGHGIQVFCDYERIQPMDNYVIQEYIREPYLIDGFKFDLRIYALLTSCDPLRVFIFNNGLVRMSTEKYETPNRKNASHLFMHLTNYSVNKYNVDYEISASNANGENTGSKRSLKFLFEYLRSQNQDANTLWRDIQNIILKTVFLAQPHLFAAYRMCRPGASPSSESVCFEILGFDILVDRNLKPWVLEVNRCPSFGTNEQIDFDIKMKLLLDTFELLRFRTSDRKKSLAIEKAEAQRRLYSNIGKTSRLLDDASLILSNGTYRDFRTRQKKLADVKEKLYLLQRETARETFENRHLGSFIRLFPVEDSIRMSELMIVLTKCFDVLYANRKDLSWSTKYYNRFKEEELLEQLTELEDLDQSDQKRNPRLAFVSNNSLPIDRASPSASFVSELTDDDDEHNHQDRSSSPQPSDFVNKTTSSTNTITTNGSLLRRYTPQSRTNVLRTTPISPLILRKQRQSSIIPTNILQRPNLQSQASPSDIKTNRAIEKKSYSTSSSQNADRPTQQSRLTTRVINSQTQMVTFTTITQTGRKQQSSMTPSIGRSTSFNTPKELQINDDQLNHLYQSTLEQMHQLCIRYPNKSDDETRRICNEIVENWNKYRSLIGEFWLSKLDTKKRQAIIRIVWNNVQQIMKQLWTVDHYIEQLSLSKHLAKLEQRLLANSGQYLWDICQNRYNSWGSSLVTSTNRVSPIELACCNRFIELCKQALFIVYRYSVDEKIKKQQEHQSQGSTIMAIS
ncbi:unnamed protein product [Rotaria socialis]|uniref:Tubulin polyglutamylase TTLL7-like n=1 Tax=Rotaria socialis TaxID=392032 RepID=A0A817SQQ3_9BILA|nr:unnamed protein product [Rotaria socialis]CAF3298297.1 unnamed protein product [Rotaria socialis]CAF3318152.1 unnamed protein product [Rotaria socialis]CAF3318646.1 unnamed protein product [Rotaria socialis]CAF3357085.1 unnamed protein product [Rotaria socialis]